MKIRLHIVIIILVCTQYNLIYGQYVEAGFNIKFSNETTNYGNKSIVNPVTGNSYTFSDVDSLRFKRGQLSFNFSIARALPKAFRVVVGGGYEMYYNFDDQVQFMEAPQYLFVVDQGGLRTDFVIQKYFFQGWLFTGLGISNHIILGDFTEQVASTATTAEEMSDYSFLKSTVQPDVFSKKTYIYIENGVDIGAAKALKLSLGIKYRLDSLNIINKSEFYFEFGFGFYLGYRAMTKIKIHEPLK